MDAATEDDAAEGAIDHGGIADRHHRRESTWRASLLLGSLLAALAGSIVVVGMLMPERSVVGGLPGRVADGTALFLICVVFVVIALLTQWPVDDRLRRSALPVWFFAIARGVTLALITGLSAGLIAAVVGLWGAAGWGSTVPFFVSGLLAGMWIGLFGAVLGSLLERSRVARIVGIVLVLCALVGGILVLGMWRGGW